MIEGRDTVKLSWIVPQKDGDIGQRGTYWIAPSLGYAVVRIEEDSKVGPNLPWKPVKNLSLAGFHEVGGLWFPASGRLVDHNYYVKDGGYEVSKELAAEFTDWKLDIPVSDKMFLYVFPKDTLVDDYVSGNRTYRVGAIDDPRIKSQVAQAKDMITTPENDLKTRFAEAVKDDPFGVGNPHWWLYSTVGLVIVLAVSSFSILRTKNKLFKGHA